MDVSQIDADQVVAQIRRQARRGAKPCADGSAGVVVSPAFLEMVASLIEEGSMKLLRPPFVNETAVHCRAPGGPIQAWAA